MKFNKVVSILEKLFKESESEWALHHNSNAKMLLLVAKSNKWACIARGFFPLDDEKIYRNGAAIQIFYD